MTTPEALMTSPDDLHELERLARAAPKMGGWWFPAVALIRDGFTAENAAFIAACSPARILSLVVAAREAEALREENAAYTEELAYQHARADRATTTPQWAKELDEAIERGSNRASSLTPPETAPEPAP
jgi:hypothetical protein